jgi:hypothetical protein
MINLLLTLPMFLDFIHSLYIIFAGLQEKIRFHIKFYSKLAISLCVTF